MTKKEISLVIVVAALSCLYVIYFTDWFRHKSIRIESTVRSLREAWSSGGRRADPAGKQVNNVTFSLHKDYRLTSIKVVPTAEFQTNKYAHPLWHLISEKGSKPVNGIAYGFPIPGMTPATPSLEIEPLEAGVEYLLLVEARSIKGTNNFSIPRPVRASR